jgi:hypothetical protein
MKLTVRSTIKDALEKIVSQRKGRILQELKFITDKLPKCTSILKETNMYVNAMGVQYSTCKTRHMNYLNI